MADTTETSTPSTESSNGTPPASHEPVVVPGGWQALYQLNTSIIKNPNLIYPGQVLTLPDNGIYTVVSGDTLSAIANGQGKGTYTTPTPAPSPEARVEPTSADTNSTSTQNANNAAAQARAAQFVPAKDWRVRISLAPSAQYFYNAPDPGILAPLKGTGGVIFPYSPSISVTYSAHYDTQDLTHSNYKPYTYKNSSIDQISITADFTAQDINEANYLLAVIHFFRSASKMFYGRDQNPPAGLPPPMLYLSGYGAYQFDNHPLVLTSFAYTLPTDVDYISASLSTDASGKPVQATISPTSNSDSSSKGNIFDQFKAAAQRLLGSGLKPGAAQSSPQFTSSTTINDATQVPTKIQMQLSFLPIQTRYSTSNQFSLKDYATGKLLRGSRSTDGGFW